MYFQGWEYFQAICVHFLNHSLARAGLCESTASDSGRLGEASNQVMSLGTQVIGIAISTRKQ